MPAAIDNNMLRLSSIEGVDCIGDSRSLINNNFTVLGSQLSAAMVALSALSTNPKNLGGPTTLTTYVSSLSVFNFNGSYIGFIPIYR
jgi:hypothetical protein